MWLSLWEVMAVAREARSEDLSQDNLTRQEDFLHGFRHYQC